MIVTRSSDASLTVKDGIEGGGRGGGSGGGDGGGGGTGGGRTVDIRVLMTGSLSTLVLPTPLQRVDQAK